MKHNEEGRYANLIFVLVGLIMYVCFLFLDLMSKSVIMSRNIKFSIILLCFCYALIQRKSAGKGIIFCSKIALLFTLISDLFLLILDYYTLGVITFIIVQQLYGVRLKLEECCNQIAKKEISRKEIDKKGITDNTMTKGINLFKQAVNNKIGKLLLRKLSYRILVQVAITLVIVIVLLLSHVTLDGLLLVSIFYFICIVTNTISAVKAAWSLPRNRSNVLFAMGMVLFLLCDINVGLFNLSGFIVMPDGLATFANSVSAILMWTFYAPSQLLITLSICYHKDYRMAK